MIRRLWLFALIGLCAAPGLAAAAQPAERNIRGTVDSFDGSTLTIQSRDNETVRVAVDASTAIFWAVRVYVTDATRGSFVGIAATGPKDKLRALEVLIYPDAMSGTDEGQHDWDLKPGSVMTHAMVDQTAASEDGQHLTLTQKGEALDMVVPAGTPVVTLAGGNAALLKPQEKVFVTATDAADGVPHATFVAVGKKGITPPM